MPTNKSGKSQSEFYDLCVLAEKIERNCTCNMKVGGRLYLESGKISLPNFPDFCIYALQAVIPFLRPNSDKTTLRTGLKPMSVLSAQIQPAG